MSINKLISVKKRLYRKSGEEVQHEKNASEIRLSFYFDTVFDNHHIQFNKHEERREIVKLLKNLADIIEKAGL